MKIEVISKDSYRIFINQLYIKEIDLEYRESITMCVKDILLKLRSRLQLRGFYKVKVFPNKKVGLFLEVIQLEDLEFSNNFDLRVVVYFDEKFFFETDDYFVVKDCSDIRFCNDKFYGLIDDCFNDLFKFGEFGRIIYGSEVINLLNNGVVL